jgi:2-polyprenyl-3-methyl-5-hydroxy-6-metoxy-1,4-benzoquinol methylase
MEEIEIPHGETPDHWTYTHGHDDAVLRSHRWRTALNSAAYLLPVLRPGMTLLDVGCGPGTLTADLAARVAPGATVGIDLEPAVVAEASRVAAERGVSTLTFSTADLHSVVAPTGGYDVVHAHQVLQHLADPVAALQAMGALVADTGVVAARDADYSAMTWWPSEPSLDRWLEIYRGVTRHNRAECDAGRRLLHWARQAGFADVEYTTSTWTFCTRPDLEWWCDLWADRVGATRFADQAVEFGLSDRDELAAIARAWRTWGLQADAVFVVPHGEIIARP